MIFAIALLLGVREQNQARPRAEPSAPTHVATRAERRRTHASQLAALFMLMWCTQMFGLLTELLARPVDDAATGGSGDEHAPLTQKTTRQSGVRRAWATATYTRRAFPHALGYFPYVSAWYILGQHFKDSLDDLKIENRDRWDRIPDFVVPAVVGTCLIFLSFVVVQCAASPRERPSPPLARPLECPAVWRAGCATLPCRRTAGCAPPACHPRAGDAPDHRRRPRHARSGSRSCGTAGSR